MKATLAHLLTYLYPRLWRDRYGAEFEELLADERSSLRTLVNVGCAALKEHLLPTPMLLEGRLVPSFGVIVKKPSALLPMAMSLGALGAVLAHIAIAGIAPQADEGTAAHVWQLLMAAQMPILLFFAIRWLPKARRQALCVMGLQAAAIAVSLAPVFLLHW